MKSTNAKGGILLALALVFVLGGMPLSSIAKKKSKVSSSELIEHYYDADFLSGTNPDIHLHVNKKSKNFDLSEGNEIEIFFDPARLTNEKEKTSNYVVETYQLIDGTRVFMNSLSTAIDKNSIKEQIIKINLGYFESSYKLIEFDIYNSSHTMSNSYKVEIHAHNLDSQSADHHRKIVSAECSKDSFDECHIQYMLSNLVFEAKPSKMVTTSVKRLNEGFYKVTVPIARRKKSKKKKSKKPSIALHFDNTSPFAGPAPVAAIGESVTFTQVTLDKLNFNAVNGIAASLEYEDNNLYITDVDDGVRRLIGAQGPNGPPGPQGPKGDMGPAGPAGSFSGGSASITGELTFSTNGEMQDPVINGTALFNNNSVAQFNGNLLIPSGASNGYVLTSDANGYASWQVISSGGGSNGGPSAGVAGAIQFSDGSNGFSADATNLFWDDGANRLGIGTNSPSASFDVVGTFQYVDGNQSAGYVLTSDASGNATWQVASGGSSEWTDTGSVVHPTEITDRVGIGITNPSEELEVNGDIMAHKTIVYDEIYSNTSATNVTIDWNNGNKQTITMAHNIVFTFTDPSGPGAFTLILKQDATGSRTITWPASAKWPSGIPPALSSAANAIDLVSCIYDGSLYLCSPMD